MVRQSHTEAGTDILRPHANDNRRQPAGGQLPIPEPSPALLKDLYEVNGGLCRHCGTTTSLNIPPAHDSDPGRRATIEYIVPRGRGGSNDWNNLALACQRCRDRRRRAATRPQPIPGWADIVAEARAEGPA